MCLSVFKNTWVNFKQSAMSTPQLRMAEILQIELQLLCHDTIFN